MKLRSEIEGQYKWDLSPLCENDEMFYQRLEKIKGQLPKFQEYKGKLNDKDVLWDYLCFDEKVSNEIESIYQYCSLKSCEVLSDNSANEMCETISNVFSQFSYDTAFITSELHSLSDEFLDDIIADEKFKNYDKMFKDIKEEKKHILSEKEEQLLAGMDFLGGFSENMEKLSDVDLSFGEIENSLGEKYPLSHSLYGKYVRSQDRALRKNAMIALNGQFGKHINMLASNYISEVKANCYFSKIRKYSSALESALENEEVEPKVYHTLIDMVEKNLPLLFDYFKFKQKEMKLDDFYIYDTQAQFIEDAENKEYTFDEAIEIIKKAVAPLGEEYVCLVQQAKDERWIDIYPNKDKRSGAFASSIYRSHPYVLTNFEGELDDVFTLAHELGHAMHYHYSSLSQPKSKASYTIFLAEIASITNEMLLANYLLNNSKTMLEKKAIYNKIFDDVKSTIFRQTMFAEFEEKAHSLHEKGVPLTKDKLCNEYYKLVEKYFGKDVKLIDEIKYEWARIPHFFTAFYVYKYATGMICAISFVNRILSNEKGAVEDYFKFLSAGGKDTPMAILKESGCDVTLESTFEKCFDYLKNILKRWKNT
ncbi:MAG: oligoendopeptidase F [Clostridiales bacterium]|nr:oligoendopeptidase F [Clostridiales bacterium]